MTSQESQDQYDETSKKTLFGKNESDEASTLRRSRLTGVLVDPDSVGGPADKPLYSVSGARTGPFGNRGQAGRALTAEEMANVEELYARLPVVVVHALWRNGYDSVKQVAETSDNVLRYCRHIGTDRLSMIREAIPYEGPQIDEPEDPRTRIRELEAKVAELQALVTEMSKLIRPASS